MNGVDKYKNEVRSMLHRTAQMMAAALNDATLDERQSADVDWTMTTLHSHIAQALKELEEAARA